MRVDAYLCATRSKYKDAASAVRSYIELAKLELELRKPISQAAESLVNLARERFAQRRAGQGGQPAAPLDPEKQVEQAPSEASEPSNGVPHANETEGDDDANSLIDNGEGDAREGDDDGV